MCIQIGNKTLIRGSFATIYKSGRKWCGNMLLCGGLVSILQDIALLLLSLFYT